MKTKLSILLVLSFFFSFSVFAQKKSSKELKAEKEIQQQKQIETLIDSKNFVFEAQKLSPRGGRIIILDYNTYFLDSYSSTRNLFEKVVPSIFCIKL